MITTKFVRTALALVLVALMGIVGLEGYWAVNTKNNARHTAERAATAAFTVMHGGGDSLAGRHAADATVDAEKKHLVAFAVDPTGVVRVTVNTRARSYVLRHFGPTRSVSDVTVTGSSSPPD